MNRMIVSGRPTADPSFKIKENGKRVSDFYFAVKRNLNSEKTDFIRCVCFDAKADFAKQYIRKGIKLIIEGRFQSSQYINDGGTTITEISLVAEDIEFAEKKQDQPQCYGQPTAAPVQTGILQTQGVYQPAAQPAAPQTAGVQNMQQFAPQPVGAGTVYQPYAQSPAMQQYQPSAPAQTGVLQTQGVYQPAAQPAAPVQTGVLQTQGIYQPAAQPAAPQTAAQGFEQANICPGEKNMYPGPTGPQNANAQPMEQKELPFTYHGTKPRF